METLSTVADTVALLEKRIAVMISHLVEVKGRQDDSENNMLELKESLKAVLHHHYHHRYHQCNLMLVSQEHRTPRWPRCTNGSPAACR